MPKSNESNHRRSSNLLALSLSAYARGDVTLAFDLFVEGMEDISGNLPPDVSIASNLKTALENAKPLPGDFSFESSDDGSAGGDSGGSAPVTLDGGGNVVPTDPTAAPDAGLPAPVVEGEEPVKTVAIGPKVFGDEPRIIKPKKKKKKKKEEAKAIDTKSKASLGNRLLALLER